MMKRTLLLPASVLAFVFLVVGCLFEHPTQVADGGGSSETTNGLVLGYVGNADGTPAVNARILLRSRDYLKDTLNALEKGSMASRVLADAMTDSTGHFRIDSVQPGDYYIESNDGNKNATLLDFSTGDRDTVLLANQSLRPTGAIKGQIKSDISGNPTAYVQIYGLDRVAKVDSATGNFLFNDLPEGAYTLRALIGSPLVDPREVPGIAARISDTNNIGSLDLASFEGEDYSTWAYSRRLILNTTASGANVSNTILDFPLLVRLTKGNFDFTQSNGGHDIRFANRYGKNLRYEVERWDSAGQQAEIWVNVDTIHGNSRSDFVTLYWGKPKAPDWSDGRHVFDSSSDFAGVWHLNEEAPDTTARGLYQDASPAAQNGDDRILSTNTDGIIGHGHAFDTGDYIKAQPTIVLRPLTHLTISAWYRGTATDKFGSTIASLGDSYGLRIDHSGNVRMFVLQTKGTWPAEITTGVNVLDSAWHYIVGMYDGAALRVFIDGVEKGSTPYTNPIPYTLGPDFYIGRHGNGNRDYDMLGSLDEVSVVNHVRTSSWVKLCFESQRLNPTLIEMP